MSGFVFNTERPVFADPRVREALTYCLDFEWLNRSLYLRPLSSAPAAISRAPSSPRSAVPASDAEKALLAPFPDAVRPDVMDGTYAPPVSDGSGTDRKACARRSRS